MITGCSTSCCRKALIFPWQFASFNFFTHWSRPNKIERDDWNWPLANITGVFRAMSASFWMMSVWAWSMGARCCELITRPLESSSTPPVRIRSHDAIQLKSFLLFTISRCQSSALTLQSRMNFLTVEHDLLEKTVIDESFASRRRNRMIPVTERNQFHESSERVRMSIELCFWPCLQISTTNRVTWYR